MPMDHFSIGQISYFVACLSFIRRSLYLISDKVECGGEGSAGGGEVEVQDGRADHEVGDGGDAGEGSHNPIDAAAWNLMNINFICSLPSSF